MEILRFEQVPESAPKRKKSSRGFLALGLVAALFGISTAFASSTITINTNNQVALGQGVVTVSGCDKNIGFKPETKLSSDASTFQVTKLLIGYDYNGKGTTTSLSNDENGLIDTTSCADKALKITLYKDYKVAPLVRKVNCATTYNGTAGPGAGLEGTYVVIGDIAAGNTVEAAVPFRCDSDGSFYFKITWRSPPAPDYTGVAINWPDQTGFSFSAASFDHVTIESVDLTGLGTLNGQTT
jgi:hypothetical protein